EECPFFSRPQCFSLNDTAKTPNGDEISIENLKIGEKVLAIDHNDQIISTEVVAILHYEKNLPALFYTFTTDSGHQLSLTPEHLVYIGNQKYIQARYIDSNEHQLFIAGRNGQLKSSRILSIDVQIKRGYATPITQHGTLLVNNVSSSCYASIYHHSIGHLAMAPLRWAHQAKQIFGLINTSETNENGIHWYPKALNNLVHTHSVSASVQTKFEVQLADATCQSIKYKEREVQADIEEKPADDHVEIDISRFNKFLGRVEPIVSYYLDDNLERPNVLRHIKMRYTGDETAQELFTLSYPDILIDKEIQVTSLSWSANSSSIVVGYGSTSHEGLCMHKGAVCSWNIERYKINPNKPDITIETSTCVTTLACHPERPGIVAAGLYNGEILVWDFREQDSLIARILERQDLHRDSVTSLQWIREPKLSKKKFILVSTSQDGKILLWNPLPSKSNLKLTDAYFVAIKGGNSRSVGKPMGVTSVTFNNEDSETFIFGCDSGFLYKGSLNSVSSVQSREEGLADMSIHPKNPVTMAYQSHDSPIYSVRFSPFNRHLFLTSAHDGQLRLYSQLFANFGRCFAPAQGAIFTCRWSPSRPLVLAAGSEHGGTLIYDLEPHEGTPDSLLLSIPVQELPSSDKRSSINALEFNHKTPNILACGDSAGAVIIWKLAERFTAAQNDEIENLRILANSFGDS
ncbi:unnamed protein product, partial [Rotaria magnacalcarata]